MKINPEHLVTFSITAEYSSVSRAAEALNLSQSTVSGQLAALQEQLGQALYKREGRGIALTPAGSDLLPYASAVARSIRHAAQHMQGVRDRPARTLKVGISPILARWAAHMMIKAHGRGLALRLLPGNSTDMQRSVELSELDAAIIVNPAALASERMDTHVLGEDALHLIMPAGHPLAKEKRIPLESLHSELLLSAQACSSIRLQTERLLEMAGVHDLTLLDVGSYCSIRDGLLDGYGVSLMPRVYLQREIENGQLACVPLDSAYTALSYVLLTPPVATLGLEARALTDFLLTLRPELHMGVNSA